MHAAHPHPADKLEAAIVIKRSPTCVGLDPVLEQLPAEVRARHHEPLAAVAEFCRGVIRAAADAVPAIKLQSACFERFGGKGVLLLEEMCEYAASLGLVVIWDAKRGDIGISAQHYAAAAKRMHVDFVTVNGYVGESGIVPFLQAGLGVFVLVRTSNPDSDKVQNVRLADDRCVGEMMADMVASVGEGFMGQKGLSAAGAVVGATKANEGAGLRSRMMNQLFLIPGFGAQGGTAADVKGMLRSDGRGVLVTSSRAIIYPLPPAAGDAGWEGNIRHAALRMTEEIAIACR